MKNPITVLVLALIGFKSFAQVSTYEQITQLLDSGNIERAELLIGNTQLTVKQYLGVGDQFYKGAQYDIANKYYSIALQRVSQDSSKNLYIANQRLGLSYDKLGEFDKSLEHFYEALRIAEQTPLEKESRARIKLNIGSALDEIGEWKKALMFYQESYELKLELGDSLGVARLLNNIGIVYKNNKVYDSAVYAYKKAISFSKNKNSPQLEWQLSTNIGNVLKRIGSVDSAKFYYQKAIKQSIDINQPTQLSDSYYNLAVFEFEQGNFAECESNFNQALAISDSLKNNYELYFLHGSLSELYSAWKKPQKAYDHLLESNSFRDSLYNNEKERIIAKLQTEYETEKKEQQIVLQNAQISEQEAELQRKQVLLAAAILVIVFLMIIGQLLRNRIRKKQQIRLQEAEIRTKEAELNATISSQERERARYARDLHDGFGQMISVLNMNIKSLQDGAKPNERQKVFEASEKVIDEMYGELKNICFDLMPQTLIKHGLESALNEFVGRVNQAGKVFVELNVFGLEKRLSELQEISLYRISQEWINNILKYSDATKITLQITKDEGEITLLIEDDGTGFDKSLLMQGKGNGWKNLNTRTKLIQGELELETTPQQKGNVLIINAPSVPQEISQELAAV